MPATPPPSLQPSACVPQAGAATVVLGVVFGIVVVALISDFVLDAMVVLLLGNGKEKQKREKG